MARLDQQQITDALRDLPQWQQQADELRGEWKFDDFKQAMDFVNRVADAANAADHHPDIDIRYNKVLLVLATHSEGGITNKDVELARQIEAFLR
jgi:4a-hydroxytetrahydrobiopterin dehydratase